MSLPQLKEFISGYPGEKAFRAKQIYEWLHKKGALSFEEMSNIPLALRERLGEDCSINSLKTEKKYVSGIDGTVKYLFELEDGALIESVAMKYEHGRSVCISTQVGCRMGCSFCASALSGLDRNLSPGEMLGEIYMIQRDLGERVSNVVLMGTGEPLDNFENVVKMLAMLSDKDGLNISQRNISLSTCGLVPGIYDLAGLRLQITLAISLHAADDETRRLIMPVASAYSLEEIMKACAFYYKETGRRISFEYSLIKGVNDSPEDAEKLAALVKGQNCHINLIQVNPIKEREYIQPDRSAVSKFKSILEKNGINVTIRREMGRDIQAACGQLRRQYGDTQPQLKHNSMED